MADFNDLRAFEKVVSLQSFSAAARALGVAKSNVSRSIGRIESEFGVRLFQRSSREVALTEVGAALRVQFAEILTKFDQALDFTASLNASPRGHLKITAGIGFGFNILAHLLPRFAARYPDVGISLELTSRLVDLVAEGVDIAVRMGPLQDSRLIATHLGALALQVCAAPAYLERKGRPRHPDDLQDYDLIEMPRTAGRKRHWVLSHSSGQTVEVEINPHISVNDPHTILALVLNGGGIGCLARYLCAPQIEAGKLVDLFPDWQVPAVDVSLVFPSSRELAPAIRAFVDFARTDLGGSHFWLGN